MNLSTKASAPYKVYGPKLRVWGEGVGFRAQDFLIKVWFGIKPRAGGRIQNKILSTS